MVVSQVLIATEVFLQRETVAFTQMSRSAGCRTRVTTQREGGDAQRGDDIESTALGELTGRHEGDGDWTGHRVTGQRGHRAQGTGVTAGRR